MNMNIELFVSEKGQLVLTCHGTFEKPIDQIILDGQTGILTFVFSPDMEEWEPNCTVDLEVCKKVQNQLFCAIGYLNNYKLIAAEYVRFNYRA